MWLYIVLIQFFSLLKFSVIFTKPNSNKQKRYAFLQKLFTEYLLCQGLDEALRQEQLSLRHSLYPDKAYTLAEEMQCVCKPEEMAGGIIWVPPLGYFILFLNSIMLTKL